MKAWKSIIFSATSLNINYQKNQRTCRSKNAASAMITTIKFPNATVSNQLACSNDFIVTGAWVKANSSPVIENMISPIVITTYCGNSQNMCTEFGAATVTVLAAASVSEAYPTMV